MSTDFIVGAQVVFLLYFVALNVVYLMLNVMAFPGILRYLQARSLDRLPYSHAGLEPGISIIAPAYNEEATISASLRSLLQLIYPDYEIIVVNDGSNDGTLKALIDTFRLVPLPDAYRPRLASQRIRAIYHSADHPNLRVIDKENGGKSDALNAGLNLARQPLFCCMDADSVLMRDSLMRVVQPFLEDETTVACGTSIRVANGCDVRGGLLVRPSLPRNVLAMFQVIEYLRAFLFGRAGWEPLNAVLIISGAFGLFRTDTVIELGGYRTDTVGEDMELVVRLHRVMRERAVPYRVAFVPDPVCWTEVPESLTVLRNQRIRWQRGLAESLWLNRRLLFHRRGGLAGWFAFPFMLVFDLLGPLIEVTGYLFMGVCFLLGLGSVAAWGAFLVLAFGVGIVFSISALLLEEMSFHLYPRVGHLLTLCVLAIVENFGYRQLNTVWRLEGLIRWLTGRKAEWGTMTRNASWQRPV